jgi:hypothetical protein
MNAETIQMLTNVLLNIIIFAIEIIIIYIIGKSLIRYGIDYYIGTKEYMEKEEERKEEVKRRIRINQTLDRIEKELEKNEKDDSKK